MIVAPTPMRFGTPTLPSSSSSRGSHGRSENPLGNSGIWGFGAKAEGSSSAVSSGIIVGVVPAPVIESSGRPLFGSGTEVADMDEELQAIMMSHSPSIVGTGPSNTSSANSSASTSSLARHSYTAPDDDQEGVTLPGVVDRYDGCIVDGEEEVVVATVPPRCADRSHQIPHPAAKIPMANSPAILHKDNEDGASEHQEEDEFTPFGGGVTEFQDAESSPIAHQFFLCSVSPPRRSLNPLPQVFEDVLSSPKNKSLLDSARSCTGPSGSGAELGLLSMSPPLNPINPPTASPHSLLTGGGFMSPYSSAPMLFPSPSIGCYTGGFSSSSSSLLGGVCFSSPRKYPTSSVTPPPSVSPPPVFPSQQTAITTNSPPTQPQSILSVSPPSTVSMWFL
ncbi:hypothetical protein Pelo_5763 [Pelomyxa schiedti]|nr:hypothetical protein Pelo_5763 [Pelomyxa schiedti]